MKDHRWAPLSTVAQCRAPRHDERWEAASGGERVICWNCGRCFGCASKDGCPARARPGFPETPRTVEAEEAGAVGKSAVSSSAGVFAAFPSGELERAPAAPVEILA